MSQVIVVLEANLIEYLVRKGLKLEEFGLLLLLSRDKTLLNLYVRKATDEQKAAVLQSMVRKRLVEVKPSETFSLDSYEITEIGRSILADTTSASIVDVTGFSGNAIPAIDRNPMDEFVDRYLDLFPKGVKNGGNKPLRSNSTDVKAKMLKFMNKYRHSQETILKATGNYLDGLRGVYTYCPTSEYFIMKDGSSALATECDMVKNGTSRDELIDPFQKRM